MFKNDQCSHCFARKKDNGVTCPQYVQNIRTLCSLPARSGNVHYIFFNSLFNGFIKTTKKEEKKKEAAAAAGPAERGPRSWFVAGQNYAQTGPARRSGFAEQLLRACVPASVCPVRGRGVRARTEVESLSVFRWGGCFALSF